MTEETKKCPFCGEEINISATKCRFCGEFLNKSPQFLDQLVSFLYEEKYFERRKKILTHLSFILVSINIICFSINICLLFSDNSAVRGVVYSVLLLSNVLWFILSALICIYLDVQSNRYQCKKG